MVHFGIFAIKVAVVALWHVLLSAAVGSEHVATAKLYSFLLVTPVLKFFYFGKLATLLQRTEYCLSVTGDTLLALWVHWVVLPLCTGPYFFLSVFTQLLPLLLWELISFQVRRIVIGSAGLAGEKGSDDDHYTVRMSSNPMNYMLVPIASAMLYWGGQAIEQPMAPVTYKHFLATMIGVTVSDFFFGVLHYLSHRVPVLWREHMLHHQYHREELTFFANFYTTLPDGLLANSAILAIAVLMHLPTTPVASAVFGLLPEFAHEIVMMEYVYPGAITHAKYPLQQMHFVFFWEVDALDMLLGHERFAEYHNRHHHLSEVHFSVFGIFSDGFVKWVCDPFLPVDKRKKLSTK